MDWLRKLVEAFEQPKVGIVGASGSYESLPTSLKQMNKIMWLAIQNIPYCWMIDQQWRHEIVKHAPQWLKREILPKVVYLEQAHPSW
jgi:predicted TIM-barrel enzyme